MFAENPLCDGCFAFALFKRADIGTGWVWV